MKIYGSPGWQWVFLVLAVAGAVFVAWSLVA